MPAPPLHPAARRGSTVAAYVAAALCFLLGVWRYHDPHEGFTALIGFGERSTKHLVPALAGLPIHVQRGSVGYDGQYYAQMATDPLLRDAATDRAMDDMPLRARRILFSWTAYIGGLGRPWWILQAYALQNVVAWLGLGVVLMAWFPPATPRMLALWLAMLFGGGLLWSVRFALLDGPSLLLVALGMLALERRREWLAAFIFGVSGLGRETNLLTALALPWPRGLTWRATAVRAAQAAMVVLPLAIWFDYIHALFRSLVFTSGESLSRPFVTYLWEWRMTVGALASGRARDLLTALDLTALSVQAGFLVWQRTPRDAWWRLGCGYTALMLVLGRTLWEGQPATALRVLLPLTLAFNVLLGRRVHGRAFWPLVVLGNLTVVRGVDLFFGPFL